MGLSDGKLTLKGGDSIGTIPLPQSPGTLYFRNGEIVETVNDVVKSQTAKFFLQDMSLTYLKRINGKQKTAAFFGKKKPMKLIVSDTSGSQHKAPQYHIRFNVLTKLELDSIERSCKDKKTHIWVHKSSTGSGLKYTIVFGDKNSGIEREASIEVIEGAKK